MHQSIPTVPILPGNPEAFVQVLFPGGGGAFEIWGFETRGFKTVKARQDACFISSRPRFCALLPQVKAGFRVTVACP